MPNLLTARRYYDGEVFKKDRNIQYNIFIPQHLALPEGTFLEFGIYENKNFYRLLSREFEQTEALLITSEVTHNDKLYRELSNIEVINKRKGYCSFLYKVAISNSEIPLISDNLNTLPGSMDVWKHLRFKWQNKNYLIGYINLKHNRVYQWRKKTPDHKIWGMQKILLEDFEGYGDENLFDDMLEMGDLTFEHYTFLINFKKYIKDRDFIRLHVQKA